MRNLPDIDCRTSFMFMTFTLFVLQSVNQKRQFVSLNVNLVRKKWHLLCLTHSIGRAFSGGSQVRCYVDGAFVSSEKCRSITCYILVFFKTLSYLF